MIAGFTTKQTCQLLVLKPKISRSISLTNHTKNSNGQSFLRNSQGIPHQFSEIVTRSFAVSRSWPTHLDRSLQPGARLNLEIRPSHRSCDSGAFAKQWGRCKHMRIKSFTCTLCGPVYTYYITILHHVGVRHTHKFHPAREDMGSNMAHSCSLQHSQEIRSQCDSS